MRLESRTSMPSVETLTIFRMPFLQSHCYVSSGGRGSFTGERPILQSRGLRGASRLGNSVEGWSRHTQQFVKVAGHGCSSTFTEGLNIAKSSQQEVRRPIIVRSLEKASDHSDTTNFFFDELIEAKAIVEKLAEPDNSPDLFHPRQEEGTSQREGDEDSEKSPETDSSRDAWQGSGASTSGRIPVESNGPPMVILQPYLTTDKSQEQVKEKLRQLPLPMPHKMRPVGLPRPSLRRRLGVAYTRKSVPVGKDSDSFLDI